MAAHNTPATTEYLRAQPFFTKPERALILRQITNCNVCKILRGAVHGTFPISPKLVKWRGRRIAQRNQLPRWVFGRGEGGIRIRIHNSQNLPAANPANSQRLT